MTTPRDQLELYVMGEHDDPAAIEQALTGDDAARAFLASEARFETLLRDAAAAAAFCPGCGDLVRAERCDACGAALRPGGYTVERVLVGNAHGRMYVARDTNGSQVALKELAFVQSPTLSAIAAFEREAKVLRALEHASIPRFVASFEEGAGVHVRYYLAQELVTGESLDARLGNHWFTEVEIIEIARQVLRVLVYLQSLSPMVIHRDIKPANLIARTDGSIAVVDFGAAHVQGTTAGSTSIGTFGYMPIEQLAGIIDATTDPYALGASLLHLLTRREPWRILQESSFEHVNISPALRGFLGTLVAPEPRHRFSNAAAALEALERAAKDEAPRSPKRDRAQWRRPALLVVGGLEEARKSAPGARSRTAACA
ncbi:MAG TPA: serine/threonine-protein kinase [Kofleriaceae bacterium]|nr:serine/threonine-protein kinase [Kofleriaceae bacterium]